MSSLKDHLRWNRQEVESQSLSALIPLTLATGLHGEDGGTLQGSKNSLRPGKPSGGCWQLLLHWRNALKDSAGPPLRCSQMFATAPRAEANREEDHGGGAAGIVGPHQGKATNLSPLHRVQMVPINGSLSWTQEQGSWE